MEKHDNKILKAISSFVEEQNFDGAFICLFKNIEEEKVTDFYIDIWGDKSDVYQFLKTWLLDAENEDITRELFKEVAIHFLNQTIEEAKNLLLSNPINDDLVKSVKF